MASNTCSIVGGCALLTNAPMLMVDLPFNGTREPSQSIAH
jgi:hypothetical protein